MRELVIIGGGAAGLAAAVSAYDSGVRDILIIERATELGGILNQCIHNGFGLHTFKEELTGPEYASRFIEEAKARNIEYNLGSMVIDVKPHYVTYVNSDGLTTEKTKAIILAMGCRERPRGALNIPGYRPAGIFSAGTAQRLVNIEGYDVGKRIVILGSGDIGLIMARRLTLEGAKVLAVAEIMPYSGGLKRNIVQCLNDYSIPLYLSHTVVDIRGKERVEGVTIAAVDDNRKPIKGSEIEFECDTLLLSVGLLPENELSSKAGLDISPVTGGPVVDNKLQSSLDGIFAAGNVLHVHDLVDFVSLESEQLASSVARYLSGKLISDREIAVRCGRGIGHAIPQRIVSGDGFTLSLRVSAVVEGAEIRVSQGGKDILCKRMRRANPAEMIMMDIGAGALSSDADLEVSIE